MKYVFSFAVLSMLTISSSFAICCRNGVMHPPSAQSNLHSSEQACEQGNNGNVWVAGNSCGSSSSTGVVVDQIAPAVQQMQQTNKAVP